MQGELEENYIGNGEASLSTREAIDYLIEKFGVTIAEDTFYHKVLRENIPHEKIRIGKVHRWLFTRRALDKMNFQREKQRVHPKEYAVEIKSHEDLIALGKEHGTLVDSDGIREAIYREHGVYISAEALKQKRYRGTIVYVGYQGHDEPVAGRKKTKKSYWYPLSQVPYLRVWKSEGE